MPINVIERLLDTETVFIRKEEKMLKKIVSICITAALCLTMSSPVFASEIHFDQSAADTNENGRMLVDETILQIQEELSVNNTTVVAELENLISEFSRELETASTDNTAKIQDLIDGLEDLKDDYTSYTTGQNQIQRSSIYSPAIGAVVAFFGANDYVLSAELLVHEETNETLGSAYYPVHQDIVGYSPVMDILNEGSTKSGRATFTKTGGTEEMDLYYGIHHFNWSRKSIGGVITISDYYNYGDGDEFDYSSIAGIAISTLAAAEKAGELVPFYTTITWFPSFS